MPYFAVDIQQTIYVEAETAKQAEKAVKEEPPFLLWFAPYAAVRTADKTKHIRTRQLKRRPTQLGPGV